MVCGPLGVIPEVAFRESPTPVPTETHVLMWQYVWRRCQYSGRASSPAVDTSLFWLVLGTSPFGASSSGERELVVFTWVSLRLALTTAGGQLLMYWGTSRLRSSVDDRGCGGSLTCSGTHGQ